MKKIWFLITPIAIFLLIGGFISFIYFSNPISINGIFTNYKDQGLKEIVFNIENMGIKELTLKEVTINHNKTPKELALGISYDTLQVVQSGTDSQNIKFMDLNKENIYPKIPSEKVIEIINRNEMTPISYGIRVEFYEENIETLNVKYKYFGFPVTKKISVKN